MYPAWSTVWYVDGSLHNLSNVTCAETQRFSDIKTGRQRATWMIIPVTERGANVDFFHGTTPGKSTFRVTMFRWYSATSRRSCWVRFSFSSSRRLSRSSCWNSRSSKCLLSTSNRSASFGEKGMKTRHTRMAAAFLTCRKKILKANSPNYLSNY